MKQKYPHGYKYAALSIRTTYQIETHGAFHRCLPKKYRYAETNASLFKVVEHKIDCEWVEIQKTRVKFQIGRRQGKKAVKKRRNPNRVDVRVMSPPKWRGFFWHRLLAFFFHNQEGLSRAAFRKFEVDHTNKDFRRIDWRRLCIVEPQGGH